MRYLRWVSPAEIGGVFNLDRTTMSRLCTPLSNVRAEHVAQQFQHSRPEADCLLSAERRVLLARGLGKCRKLCQSTVQKIGL